jgi:hypothetical protein
MRKLADVLSQHKALVPPKSLRPQPIPSAVWEAAVGTRIASRAEPVRLDKGLLQVRVANAAWANELALLSSDILGQLQQRGVAVEALRFTVGPMQAPTVRREPPRPAAPKHASVPPALSSCFDRVEDEGLREALRDAAAKTLSIPRIG